MQTRWHILEEFLIMRILDNWVNQVNIDRLKKTPDIHRNMKLLLKIHNKPSILFKDFKNRPLVNNTTKDKNKELV